MAAAAVVAGLSAAMLGALAGPQVAHAQEPTPGSSSQPLTPDPSLAIERAQAGRIRAMALVAARQARRLLKQHAPAGAFGALRIVYRNEASIVLLPRRAPYTLTQLHASFPSAVTSAAPGIWLVQEHVLVGPGAHLVVAAPETRELRILSTAGRFATIAGWKATIDFQGTTAQPLRIGSWDPVTASPDVSLTDGRAYVIAKAGRMDVTDAEVANLGFATGESSGIAWRGWPGIQSRGSALRTQFRGNYFGAYTFEAVDMVWKDNTFAANVGYGFDPHDHSDRFTVTGNMAYRNGGHGMVFSRGCSKSTLRNNLSAFNAGNGFVLDDGRVASDGDPRHLRPEPSNDNVIAGNIAWGNDAGLALEGASHNTIQGNLLVGNRVGVRLKDASSGNELAGNTIIASSIFGVLVNAGSVDNSASGNRVFGAKVGIAINGSTGNHVEHNSIGWVTGRGIVLSGAVPDTFVTANTISGKGTAAIDTNAARDLPRRGVTANAVMAWTGPRQFREIYTAGNFLRHHPAIAVWLAIFLVPLVWWLPARRRRLFAWGRNVVARGAP